MGVLFWFGGLVFLHLFLFSWFFSLLLLRFGLVFLRFWKLSFSVQTDSNTRGRTTPTGALQCHCVGQALQGSALPLLARLPCPLVREFGGNLQRHLACRLSDGSLRRWRPISERFSAPMQGGSLSAFPSLWSFVRRSSHSLWLRMMRYVSVFAPS